MTTEIVAEFAEKGWELLPFDVPDDTDDVDFEWINATVNDAIARDGVRSLEANKGYIVLPCCDDTSKAYRGYLIAQLDAGEECPVISHNSREIPFLTIHTDDGGVYLHHSSEPVFMTYGEFRRALETLNRSGVYRGTN